MRVAFFFPNGRPGFSKIEKHLACAKVSIKGGDYDYHKEINFVRQEEGCRASQVSVLMMCVVALVVGDGRVSLAVGQDELNPQVIHVTAPLQFLGPDGSPIVVPEDHYMVEQAEDWLRLIPSGGSRTEALVLDATIGTHQESLGSPMAMVLPGTPMM